MRCLGLVAVPGIAHGFSLRWAERDPRFDMGGPDEADPAVRDRRRRFVRSAGIGGGEPLVLRQVHGSEVVTAPRAGSDVPAADGWIWVAGSSGRGAAVRTADCVAVMMLPVSGGAAACLHAGWRGTASGIVRRGVEALAAIGAATTDLVVALGPAVLGCCYEVGEEVAERVAGASGGEGPGRPSGTPGRRFFDLHAALAFQLAAAGVPGERIHGAPWCTRCRGDLFFSHRREGAAAGRQLAVVGSAATP